MDNHGPMATMEASLKFELMLKTIGNDGVTAQVSLGDIRRGEVDDVALLGLELCESKRLLSSLQHEIVTKQVEAMTCKRQSCACCGATLTIKDYQPARFRSLFGDVELRVPRHVKCGCADARSGQPAPRRRWVSAELECVQSELAATLSYQRSAQVLRMLMPMGRGHSASTVRARTLRVGKRLEAELTEAHALSVHPSRVSTIGLDGGYVRHCDPESTHSFEIIAGRVLAQDGSQRSMGFVRSIDEHSRERVQRAVAELGGGADDLRVFTDGDGPLRDLQLAVLPEATHVLDWYHLTRRLTVLASVVNGKEAADELPARDHDRFSGWVNSIKWRLWHGRPAKAIARLQSMLGALARPSLQRNPVVKRMKKLAAELLGYLKNNADSIPDYGRRYRAGERISTSFVESAVNQIVDKRMSKSQQMHWSPQGAHLILQVRTSVIDGRLREHFARWHPGFSANDSDLQRRA